MAFLAPLVLWGSLAAGIPVALHLFFRSRYRTVPWAAMKFLLTSVEQTSRRLRFQELLLLMLRILVLAVLALALARPVLPSFFQMAMLGLFISLQAFVIARLVTSGRPSWRSKLAELGAVEAGGLGALLLLGLIGSLFPGESVIGGRGDAVDAVFVIDTSMSMDARDGSQTRLDHARAEALRILDDLPARSTVQIVTCAGGTQALAGPRSPTNRDAAREILDQLTITQLNTDLAAGVTRAADILEHAQSPNKELYVFSDMQKQGWERNAEALKERFDAVKQRASVVLVRCGKAAVKNVAVVEIVPQAGVPRPGSRANFAVLLRNTGNESVEKLQVTLTVDGDDKRRESQAVDAIAPGETKTVPLSAKLEKAGLHVLTARVAADDLDGDNRLDRVIAVRDFVNILVVDGAYDEHDPEKSSSYGLAHAVMPARDADVAGFYFQPRVVRARLAAPALLAKADLCILSDVAVEPRLGKGIDVLPSDFVAALGPFVRQGHGLVIFAGNNVVPEAYNRVLGKKHDLLPMPLTRVTHLATQDVPVFLNRDTFSRPAFDALRTDKRYEVIGAMAAWQFVEVQPPKTEDGVKPAGNLEQDRANGVLVRYDNGKPAVVTRSLDGGEVVFVTTAPRLQRVKAGDGKSAAFQREWSNWPEIPVFVPLVHTLINTLMHGQSEVYNLTAGEVLHWFPNERINRAFTLVHPDGKVVRLGQPTKKGKRYEVTADDLPRAGVYHLVAHVPTGEGDSPEMESPSSKESGIPIAAAPDLSETADLSVLDDAVIDERLGFTPIHLQADSGAATLSAADRLNREWTSWLLVGVLLLLLCEGVLAWVCGRAW